MNAHEYEKPAVVRYITPHRTNLYSRRCFQGSLSSSKAKVAFILQRRSSLGKLNTVPITGSSAWALYYDTCDITQSKMTMTNSHTEQKLNTNLKASCLGQKQAKAKY